MGWVGGACRAGTQRCWLLRGQPHAACVLLPAVGHTQRQLPSSVSSGTLVSKSRCGRHLFLNAAATWRRKHSPPHPIQPHQTPTSITTPDGAVHSEVLGKEGRGAQPLPVGGVQAPACEGLAGENSMGGELARRRAWACRQPLPAAQVAREHPSCCTQTCAPPCPAHQSASMRYLSNTACPASQLHTEFGVSGRERMPWWLGGDCRTGAACVLLPTLAEGPPACLQTPQTYPPAPQVAAREEAGHGVASQVVYPALLPQLRHDGINPAGSASGWGGSVSGRTGSAGAGPCSAATSPKKQLASRGAPSSAASPWVPRAALLPRLDQLGIIHPGDLHVEWGGGGGADRVTVPRVWRAQEEERVHSGAVWQGEVGRVGVQCMSVNGSASACSGWWVPAGLPGGPGACGLLPLPLNAA